MQKIQFFLIFFLFFIVISIIADEKEYEILLGHWYGSSNQYYEMYDTLYHFRITKNVNNSYTLYYNYIGSETLMGIIVIDKNDINVRAGNKHIFKFLINNSSYLFNINLISSSSYDRLDGFWICSFSGNNMVDSWNFIKKSDIIKKHIPKHHSERPLIGYINNNGVRLRVNYGLSGNIIRNLNKNEEVSIIEISPSIEVINGNYEYWYKVISSKGETGWVYGAYLELDGNKMYAHTNWPPIR